MNTIQANALGGYEWVGQVISAAGSAYGSIKSARNESKIVGVQVKQAIEQQKADAEGRRQAEAHQSALRAIELRAAEARAAVSQQVQTVRSAAAPITSSPWFWPGAAVAAVAAAALFRNRGPRP